MNIKKYDVPCFCLRCGYWIGVIDVIDMHTIISIQPLCRKCFAELKIKTVTPHVSK